MSKGGSRAVIAGGDRGFFYVVVTDVKTFNKEVRGNGFNLFNKVVCKLGGGCGTVIIADFYEFNDIRESCVAGDGELRAGKSVFAGLINFFKFERVGVNVGGGRLSRLAEFAYSRTTLLFAVSVATTASEVTFAS